MQQELPPPPPAHIARFSTDVIRAIDSDGTIIEKFTDAQLKALTPTQIGQLKVDSIKDMMTAYTAAGTEPTAAQIAAINPTLLTKPAGDADFISFSAKQINSMSKTQLDKLAAFSSAPDPVLISELNPKVLAMVKASVIDALDDTEKAVLTAAQIKTLSPEKIVLLNDGTDFSAISTEAVNALSAAQIKALANSTAPANLLSTFTDDQLANLNGAALKGAALTGTQQEAIFDAPATQISDSNAAGLAKEVIATITDFAALTLLTTTGIKAIPPEAFAGMTASASATLSAVQFGVLTPEQVKAITPPAMAAILDTVSSGLTVAQAKKLSAEQVDVLTVDQIKGTTADALKAIPATSLIKLDATQAAEIDAMVLTPAQLAKIPPVALVALTNIADISADQIKLLTKDQITKLSTNTTDLSDIIDSFADVAALSAANISVLTKAAIADLDTMVADFSAAQWKAVSATAITGITATAVADAEFTFGDAAALNYKQLNALAADSTAKTAVFQALDVSSIKASTLNYMNKVALNAFTDTQEAEINLVGVTTLNRGYINDASGA